MADQAGDTIMSLQRLSDRAGLSIDLRAQLRASLTAVADRVPSFTASVVDVGVTVVRQVTYLIIIVVISISMLLDAKRLGRFVAGHFPTHSVSDGEEYVRRAKTALIDYVEAQVRLSAVLVGSVGLAMWFLGMIGAFPSGARYALFFGVWAGLMEAIPSLGPVLAAVPPTLAAAGGVVDSPARDTPAESREPDGRPRPAEPGAYYRLLDISGLPFLDLDIRRRAAELGAAATVCSVAREGRLITQPRGLATSLGVCRHKTLRLLTRTESCIPS